MHLRPYGFLVMNKNQINEWRGRKNGCNVTIRKRYDQNKEPYFTYEVVHQRGTYNAFSEDNKQFDSLEDAREDVIQWIDFFSYLNGPLLALSHYK